MLRAISSCDSNILYVWRPSRSPIRDDGAENSLIECPEVYSAVSQSHQIPFQDCWSVSIIHKLPDTTPDHIHRQFEIAYQLLLQSRRTSTLAPSGTYSFLSVLTILLQTKNTVFLFESFTIIYFSFHFYVLRRSPVDPMMPIVCLR